MHSLIVPPLLRSLGALDAILAKAEAHCTQHGIDPAVLFAYRLYPDMLPFNRQVQLVCDFSARLAARLAGQEPRSFPDTEASLAELRPRVATARDYIAGFAPEDYTSAADREIVLTLRSGEMRMTGAAYYASYALPQVHFHMTTAYAILRHNGVVLGKRDYMGG